MHNEKLIELVRNYGFLYNQDQKSYSDNDKREIAWKEIGRILNESAKDCKKQWNNLRDCFRRSMKKRRDTKSGQLSSKIKKWKFDDEMSFLIPYIKEKETVATIQAHNEANDELDNASTTEDKINLIETLSSPKIEDQATPETFRRKIKIKPKTASAVLMDYVLSNRTANIEQTMDDTDLFFKSIALSVKKLSPYNQVIAKARVSSVLSELQMQELSRTNGEHISSDSLYSTVVSTPSPSPSPCTSSRDTINNAHSATSCIQSNHCTNTS